MSIDTITTHGPRVARWTLVAALGLLAGCARTMVSTPNLYSNTDTPLFGPMSASTESNVVEVLYATDRAPVPSSSGQRLSYGSARSTSGALGVAAVRLGGADEGTGPADGGDIAVVGVDELVRFPATPYLYHVDEDGTVTVDPDVVAEIAQTGAQARRELSRRLALTGRKEVYLHVHGVATEFDEAIMSQAELWHFLGREGVPLAYTWPSGAKGFFFYAVDRESGEFTVLHLKQLLRFLAQMPEVERIHITAHSRGTDVVITALRELIIELRASGANPRQRLKVENLILLAADIDLEVHMQRVVGEAMGPAVGRVTIYTHAEDKAIAASRSMFSSRQRLGSLNAEALDERQKEFMRRFGNLDLIVYAGAGGGGFKHGYFRHPAVSSDILMVLRYGWRPGEGRRQGLEPLGDGVWRIGDAYLAEGG